MFWKRKHQPEGGNAMAQELQTPGRKAVNVFRKPPQRLNCAQAVAHAWAQDTASTHTAIAEHAAHGSGKAPDGECGALYAARQVAKKQGRKTEHLHQGFAAIHGHTACSELRARRVACEDCVRTAADLVAAAPQNETGSGNGPACQE
jgi:hypothetical protein